MSVELTLSAAQVAALAAGTPVSIAISDTLELVPPSAPPVPPDPPPAGQLKTVFVQNGATPNWPQNYSYDATATYGSTSPAGNGNPKSIAVVTTGSWGGFQPSNNPGSSTSVEGDTLTVDIDAAAGEQFSMQFLMAGDTPVKDANGNQTSQVFTKTKTGYETFTVAKSVLMTDATKGDVSGEIYKGAIQSKSSSSGVAFAIDNWGSI